MAVELISCGRWGLAWPIGDNVGWLKMTSQSTSLTKPNEISELLQEAVYIFKEVHPQMKIQSLSPYLSADRKSWEVSRSTKYFWSFTGQGQKIKRTPTARYGAMGHFISFLSFWRAFFLCFFPLHALYNSTTFN